MLEFQIFGVRWRLSLLFPAMLTTLLLWRPDSLAFPCVLASLIHEGGHLLAMMVLGVPPQDFSLGVFGARIHINGGKLSYVRNILISLSGPVINIFSAALLLLFRCPVPAFIHLLLAGVNLLPAAGLDGGEILRCCLFQFGLTDISPLLLRITSVVVLLPLAVAGFYMLITGAGNGSLLVISAYLAFLIFFADKNEKTLDKSRVG